MKKRSIAEEVLDRLCDKPNYTDYVCKACGFLWTTTLIEGIPKGTGETMPIKWSAVKVSEAMDEVEKQVSLAEAFFAEARAKASVALNIADLPGYMEDRIRRLIGDIDRIDYVMEAIKATPNAIPAGAIEAERKSTLGTAARSHQCKEQPALFDF